MRFRPVVLGSPRHAVQVAWGLLGGGSGKTSVNFYGWSASGIVAGTTNGQVASARLTRPGEADVVSPAAADTAEAALRAHGAESPPVGILQAAS
jgi:hypothetical protein